MKFSESSVNWTSISTLTVLIRYYLDVVFLYTVSYYNISLKFKHFTWSILFIYSVIVMELWHANKNKIKIRMCLKPVPAFFNILFQCSLPNVSCTAPYFQHVKTAHLYSLFHRFFVVVVLNRIQFIFSPRISLSLAYP